MPRLLREKVDTGRKSRTGNAEAPDFRLCVDCN